MRPLRRRAIIGVKLLHIFHPAKSSRYFLKKHYDSRKNIIIFSLSDCVAGNIGSHFSGV